MKTTAKAIGFDNGYRTGGRQAGRNASTFLSTPCNRFEMPPRKRSNRTAGTRTVARQKCHQQFDEEIIARYPRWGRVILCAVAVLTLSGILPMALATFQIWLGDVFGLGATALCLIADAALIAGLWRL